MGAALGPGFPAAAAVVAAALAVVGVQARRRWPVVAAVAVVAGMVSGISAAGRERATWEASVPEGPVILLGHAGSDPVGPPGRARATVKPDHLLVEGAWVPWPGPRLMVRGVPDSLSAGERVYVSGTLRAERFRVLQGPVSGVVVADEFRRLAPPSNPMLRLANGLRNRILSSLSGVADSPEGALLSGFLIGDVRRLSAEDHEALRRASLSHFVVVSGSNVALFLAAWWLASGPLGWSPRRRILVGLVGIVVFALVTRWEPSVLRASAMAAAVLGGRLLGVPIGPVTALSLAVTALVLVSGSIVADVGFQLSVAATAGILVGLPLWAHRRPLWVWATLGATMSAQAAVAPLLLVHFGSVPLMAPATNLLAAPLVMVATAVGGVGAVLGLAPVVEIAAALAWMVLMIARTSADLPQLGWWGAIAVGLAAAGAVRYRGIRPVMALVGVALLAAAAAPPRPPGVATAIFLDVGQGDATLFLGPAGEVVLVDGGPDPVTLRRHLRRHGVGRIDLLIVSHRHADHVAGLVGITEVTAVGRLWHPPQLGHDSALDALVEEVRGVGAVVEEPSAGTTATVGQFHLRVIGPLRRYASPNDGSLVVMVEANSVTVLMAGDIEVIAQRELGPLTADVLKVPHQGGATSDPAWLAGSAPALAVISVGPNDFGHPDQGVIEILEASGAMVRRTDLEGSIVVGLIAGSVPGPRPSPGGQSAETGPRAAALPSSS